MSIELKIKAVPGTFAVARLSADAAIPDWASRSGFSAIIRAEDELTIVCLAELVPADVEAERGWACLRTVGPFEFEAAGIVRALIEPISSNGIGVFVVCTFDGEHVLVPSEDMERACSELIAAGHSLLDR
jgi:uncharacterized protein